MLVTNFIWNCSHKKNGEISFIAEVNNFFLHARLFTNRNFVFTLFYFIIENEYFQLVYKEESHRADFLLLRIQI